MRYQAHGHTTNVYHQDISDAQGLFNLFRIDPDINFQSELLSNGTIRLSYFSRDLFDSGNHWNNIPNGMVRRIVNLIQENEIITGFTSRELSLVANGLLGLARRVQRIDSNVNLSSLMSFIHEVRWQSELSRLEPGEWIPMQERAQNATLE